MANIILGKVAITWKGAWESGTAYNEQDVVSDGASTYICTVSASTPGSQPNATAGEWDQFAQGTKDIAVAAGDLVFNNGVGLQALAVGNENDVLSVNSSGLPVWIPKAVRSGQRVRNLFKYDYIDRNGYDQFVVMEDGSIRAWGYGSWLSIGNGSNTSAQGVPNIIPFSLGFPGIKDDPNECTFWAHHAYAYHAIDENGHVWAWARYGHDSIYSMTGTNGNAWTPINLMKLSNSANAFNPEDGLQSAKAVAMGGGSQSYTAAGILGTDGKVYMCGYNGYGQLGTGDTSNSPYFTRSPVISSHVDEDPTNNAIVNFRMGRDRYANVAAVDASGRLFMWGYNGDYQLGNGNNSNAATPFQLTWNDDQGALVVLDDIYPVYHSTYAKDDQNRLWYWGTDHYGVSGLGVNTGSSGNQTNVTPTFTIDNVNKFAVSNYDYPSAYVLQNDGKVQATGYNGYGQLGNDNTSNQSSWDEMTLTMLQAGETVEHIFCGGQGSYQSFGILTNQGRVYTCGYNGYGQLGVGDADQRTTLTEVPCRDQIVEATFTGHERYMNLQVRLADGQMLIAGCGDNHQLASEDGEEYYTLSPVRF